MKRALGTVVVLVLAFFVGRTLYRSFAGEETRIRWLLQDEAAAFNGSSILTVLDSFAPRFRDETTGFGRDELRAALQYAFQSRRDPETKRFLHRVELPEDRMRIEVVGESARAVFDLRLHEGLDEAERMVWEVRVHADLEKEEGEWRVVGSRHETLRGSRPGS